MSALEPSAPPMEEDSPMNNNNNNSTNNSNEFKNVTSFQNLSKENPFPALNLPEACMVAPPENTTLLLNNSLRESQSLQTEFQQQKQSTTAFVAPATMPSDTINTPTINWNQQQQNQPLFSSNSFSTAPFSAPLTQNVQADSFYLSEDRSTGVITKWVSVSPDHQGGFAGINSFGNVFQFSLNEDFRPLSIRLRYFPASLSANPYQQCDSQGMVYFNGNVIGNWNNDLPVVVETLDLPKPNAVKEQTFSISSMFMQKGVNTLEFRYTSGSMGCAIWNCVLVVEWPSPAQTNPNQTNAIIPPDFSVIP